MTEYPTRIGVPPQLPEETILIKTCFQYDDIQIGGSQEKTDILVPETPIFPLIKVCAYKDDKDVWTYIIEKDEWVPYDSEIHLIPQTETLVEVGTNFEESDSLDEESSPLDDSPISDDDLNDNLEEQAENDSDHGLYPEDSEEDGDDFDDDLEDEDQDKVATD